MSNTILGLCWPRILPATQKAVLIALADQANDDGICWIAVEAKDPDKLDLMKKTCLSRRTVQGAIRGLVEDGLLSRHEFRGDGVWYALLPNELQPGRLPKWIMRKMAEDAAVVSRAAAAPRQEMPGAGDDGTPAAAAPKPSPIPSSSPSYRAGHAPRKTCPDEWVILQGHRDKASEFGWPDGMIEDVAERFRAWEFREPKTDFNRAFTRWMITTNDDRLKGQDGTGRSTSAGGGPKPREERIGAMQRGAMAALDRFQRERGPGDPDDFPI